MRSWGRSCGSEALWNGGDHDGDGRGGASGESAETFVVITILRVRMGARKDLRKGAIFRRSAFRKNLVDTFQTG